MKSVIWLLRFYSAFTFADHVWKKFHVFNSILFLKTKYNSYIKFNSILHLKTKYNTYFKFSIKENKKQFQQFLEFHQLTVPRQMIPREFPYELKISHSKWHPQFLRLLLSIFDGIKILITIFDENISSDNKRKRRIFFKAFWSNRYFEAISKRNLLQDSISHRHVSLCLNTLTKRGLKQGWSLNDFVPHPTITSSRVIRIIFLVKFLIASLKRPNVISMFLCVWNLIRFILWNLLIKWNK